MTLSDFIVKTSFNDLPASAVHGAKRAILDCIGVMLAGSREDASKIAAELFMKFKNQNGAPVVGLGFAIEPTIAAMLNGISAHVLDYDDSSVSLTGHPSASVVAACLALASQTSVSGRDFLLAYIIGVEIEVKMALSIPEHYNWGWHNTSTFGVFGATAACSRLLSLTTDETGRALGVAASLASGLRQNFGTMTKSLHTGNAARGGLLASMLAKGGFTSDSEEAIRGPRGFCKVFSGGGAYDLQKTLRSLGNPWEVSDPGIRIKLYPCCTSNHRPIEATILLTKEQDIRPDEVEKIECGVIFRVPENLIRNEARTGIEAKFSLQYCVARALISRSVVISHFDDVQVVDPDVQELMKRISMYVHPEGRKEVMQRQFAEVKITLKNGKTYCKRVYEQEGHPLRPLTDEQVKSKFMNCATRTYESNKSRSLLELLWRIDSIPCIEPILEMLK